MRGNDMLEMRAIVTGVHGEDASVHPLGTGGCGHCDSEGGCGSGTLSKLFCSNKTRQFVVRNEARARVGDEVNVSIPDGVLLNGAMKMYVLPLLLMLAGGAVGVFFSGAVASQDAFAVAGALVGLMLGFLAARFSPGIGKAVAISVVSRSVS